MNMAACEYKRIILGVNKVLLLIHRLRMSIILSGHRLLEFFCHLRNRAFKILSSPRGIVISLILVGMIATPTILFLSERSSRIQKDNTLRYLNTSVTTENLALRNTIRELWAERLELHDLLLDAGYQVYHEGELQLKVVATGYTSSPYETDNTPFITAANTNTRRGIIALSRDLLRRYNPDAPFSFGDHVHLEGLGEFIVEDSMNRRWKRRADIWFPSRHEALHFGKKEIYLTKTLEDRSLHGMKAMD